MYNLVTSFQKYWIYWFMARNSFEMISMDPLGQVVLYERNAADELEVRTDAGFGYVFGTAQCVHWEHPKKKCTMKNAPQDDLEEALHQWFEFKAEKTRIEPLATRQKHVRGPKMKELNAVLKVYLYTITAAWSVGCFHPMNPYYLRLFEYVSKNVG